MVPFQFFLLKYSGVEPSLAILISFGTSLAIIIPTAISGAYKHTQVLKGIIKPGIRLGIFGILGGILGGITATYLPVKILEVVFGLLLLFIAFYNLLNIGGKSDKKRVELNLFNIPFIGLAAGFSSGLLGLVEESF